MTGRKYNENEVVKLMQLALKLDASCLQFCQSMKEVFDIADAIEAMRAKKEAKRRTKCGKSMRSS